MMRKLKQFIIKNKQLTTLAVILLVVIVFCTIIVFAHPELISIWKGEFTQEGWNNFSWLRYRIVDDVEVKIDIWDLSKEEISRILGPDEGYIGSGDSREILSYEIRLRIQIWLPTLKNISSPHSFEAVNFCTKALRTNNINVSTRQFTTLKNRNDALSIGVPLFL